MNIKIISNSLLEPQFTVYVFFFLTVHLWKKIHQCYIRYSKWICTNNIEQLAVVCRTWLSSLPLRDLPVTWLVGSWSGSCCIIGQDLVTLKVINSSNNGFAEETFFFLHHLVTDAGSVIKKIMVHYIINTRKWIVNTMPICTCSLTMSDTF